MNKEFYQVERLTLTGANNTYEVIFNKSFKYCTGVYFNCASYTTTSYVGIKDGYDNVIIDKVPFVAFYNTANRKKNEEFYKINIRAAGNKLKITINTDSYSSLNTTASFYFVFRLSNEPAKQIEPYLHSYFEETLIGWNSTTKSIDVLFNQYIKKIKGLFIYSSADVALTLLKYTLKSNSDIYFYNADSVFFNGSTLNYYDLERKFVDVDIDNDTSLKIELTRTNTDAVTTGTIIICVKYDNPELIKFIKK